MRRGRKVSIVGHSLGGCSPASGSAPTRPINGIVSMGSPILAPGAVHETVLAWDAEMLTRLTRPASAA